MTERMHLFETASGNKIRQAIQELTGAIPSRRFLNMVSTSDMHGVRHWKYAVAELRPILDQMKDDYQKLHALRTASDFDQREEEYNQEVEKAFQKLGSLLAELEKKSLPNHKTTENP